MALAIACLHKTYFGEDIELNEKILLLADDDILTVDAMRAVLERQGFIVEVAHDARETIALLLQLEKLDLLILDVMLPLAGTLIDEPTGGLEAGLRILHLIREEASFKRWSNLPVLCYTVRGDNRRIREELESLGARVITKGMPPKVAVDAILEMVSN